MLVSSKKYLHRTSRMMFGQISGYCSLAKLTAKINHHSDLSFRTPWWVGWGCWICTAIQVFLTVLILPPFPFPDIWSESWFKNSSCPFLLPSPVFSQGGVALSLPHLFSCYTPNSASLCFLKDLHTIRKEFGNKHLQASFFFFKPSLPLLAPACGRKLMTPLISSDIDWSSAPTLFTRG